MNPTAHTRRVGPVFGRAFSGRRSGWRPLALIIAALVATAIASGVALGRTTAARIGDGVVVIKTTLAYQDASAAGTGMVLTSSGEILTNNHVIRGATKITVVVPGTSHAYTASVVGYDVADDVAVLRVVGASNLETVTTAESSKVAVGDRITAVGNAGGTGTLSTATGSVTALQRSIVVSDDTGGAARLTGLIGVNANVVSGDSGGPLLNSAGARDRNEHRRLDRVCVPFLQRHPGLRDSDRQSALDRPARSRPGARRRGSTSEQRRSSESRSHPLSATAISGPRAR